MSTINLPPGVSLDRPPDMPPDMVPSWSLRRDIVPAWKTETRPIQFTIGRNSLSGTASRVDFISETVFRVQLHRNFFDRCICWILSSLPRLQKQIWRYRPQWILPTTVILKMLKTDWDKEFENEKVMYKELEPLQGRVIPVLYGETIYKEKPALILSDVGGYALNDSLEFPKLEEQELRRMLKEAYEAVLEFHIIHGDVKLDNCHFTGERIIILDWENAEKLEDFDVRDFKVQLSSFVGRQTGSYFSHRAALEWEQKGGGCEV